MEEVGIGRRVRRIWTVSVEGPSWRQSAWREWETVSVLKGKRLYGSRYGVGMRSEEVTSEARAIEHVTWMGE
jgi:hypothetical protein